MSDISLRYEEREGRGKFLIGSVYSQSVSKDDTITVYKKDYMGVVLRIKTDSAVTVTLDSVAANLEVPEAGVDTFIDVNETIASFAGAGETVVNLADALTKKWAVAFPYLRFKFNAAATIDFVVTAVADINSIVTASQNLTEIAGTALTGRDWSSDFANLDIALSALRDALRGANTKDFSTLEADTESILSQLDITLSTLRDALIDVTLDNLIHNNATVDSTGQSDSLAVKGAKHVDVLIRVGSMTGSPTIQCHVDVIEPTSGAVIRTYDGTSISAADTSDWITVDGLTLGTHVKVRWSGTLDASNYFSGVFCRIVAKR